MRSGSLVNRIVIEQLSPNSPDQTAGGEPDESWVTFKNAWAAIEPLRGRELIAAQATNSEVTGNIRIQYQSGITPKMRVRFGSRIFDVLSVINTREENREIVMQVREGTPNG